MDVFYDPPDKQQPFRFLEAKCPYASKDCTIEEACRTTGFYCDLDDNGKIASKREHKYYVQAQGKLALGERPWCDFVIYTLKIFMYRGLLLTKNTGVVIYRSWCNFMTTALHLK